MLIVVGLVLNLVPISGTRRRVFTPCQVGCGTVGGSAPRPPAGTRRDLCTGGTLGVTDHTEREEPLLPRTLLDRSDAVRALADVFRRRGFEAASLSVIQQEDRMGRGQPVPLLPRRGRRTWRGRAGPRCRRGSRTRCSRRCGPPTTRPAPWRGWRARSGLLPLPQRVCLFAVAALGGDWRPPPTRCGTYFSEWVDLLARTLRRGGVAIGTPQRWRVDAVAAIQGCAGPGARPRRGRRGRRGRGRRRGTPARRPLLIRCRGDR